MTIIARAPLRIGLAGGGTDLPAYADRFGGLVVSAAIDRYVYVISSEAPAGTLQITAADASTMFSHHENLFDASLFWGADYRLPRETLDYFGISGGKRIFIASEVPPGTGLGSSSSTAVSLITALATALEQSLDRREIAELACHIELDRMGMPIGKQDQYAASFGGLNSITFSADGTEIEPMMVSDTVRKELQSRLLLFFTGQRRRSTDILKHQQAATRSRQTGTLTALHTIKALAVQMREAITSGDLDAVGSILDLSWQNKRALAPNVSNPEIDQWYEIARETGALGGKITGAGGGGFLMLFAHPKCQPELIQRMSDQGLIWVDVGFDDSGCSPLLAPRDQFALTVAD